VSRGHCVAPRQVGSCIEPQVLSGGGKRQANRAWTAPLTGRLSMTNGEAVSRPPSRSPDNRRAAAQTWHSRELAAPERGYDRALSTTHSVDESCRIEERELRCASLICVHLCTSMCTRYQRAREGNAGCWAVLPVQPREARATVVLDVSGAPRSRTDGAARGDHSLWLQAERKSWGGVQAVTCSRPPRASLAGAGWVLDACSARSV